MLAVSPSASVVLMDLSLRAFSMTSAFSPAQSTVEPQDGHTTWVAIAATKLMEPPQLGQSSALIWPWNRPAVSRT